MFIARLGLFGLASISAEQKTKEIGVRKVLGGSVPQLVLALSKELLTWVVLANIVALPMAWYFMRTWLEGFAYRVSLAWWMFAAAGTITVVVALVTVSLRAARAATANLVKALRYE